MPSSYELRRYIGVSPGTATDVTASTSRYSTSDVLFPGATNSMQIVLGSTTYSFWVTHRLIVTATPDGTMDNQQWYYSPLGTGTMIIALASTGADAGYRQATGTVGDNGDVLNQTNHTGLDAAPVNATTYTAGSRLSMSGNLSNPSTGAFGEFIVTQFSVDQTSTTGVAGGSGVMTWDET